MIVEIKKEQLRINYKAREWCLLPYPGHPKGCPNYNDPKHEGICPPSAPLIKDFIDIDKPMYLIVEEFDLASHVQKYKAAHPGCTERQAKCVLYWQAGVNLKLENGCLLFKWSHPAMITTRCPEAMGVNVIATALQVGIPIKRQPDGKVYKVALGGYQNKKSGIQGGNQ